MSNRNYFPCKGTTVLGSNTTLKALNSKVILQESNSHKLNSIMTDLIELYGIRKWVLKNTCSSLVTVCLSAHSSAQVPMAQSLQTSHKPSFSIPSTRESCPQRDPFLHFGKKSEILHLSLIKRKGRGKVYRPCFCEVLGSIGHAFHATSHNNVIDSQLDTLCSKHCCCNDKNDQISR